MSQLDKHPKYPEEAAHAATTVCVTGVTGFVAGSIVARLLELGHTVHGTCRSPNDAAAVSYLQALPGAAERLKLFKADLMDMGSFDAAMAGCEYVLHTASPYIVNVKPAEVRAKLLDPAVKGTENVLGSVSRTPSIRRVVLTSSCAAIYGDPDEHGKGHVFTEADWNPTASETNLPYYYSKKLAEKRGWELHEEQGEAKRWGLVVVNPAVVIGPPLGARGDSESVTLLRDIIAGKAWPAAPAFGLGAVDVRDVAAAHCLAMVHPAAQGRYITVCRSMMYRDIIGAVKAAYPKSRLRLPMASIPKWLLWALGPAVGLPRDFVTHVVGKCPLFDNGKIQRELGFRFSPMEGAVADQVAAMLKLGIVKPF